MPLSLHDRMRDRLGPAFHSAVVKRVLTGLAGLLVSAAVAAIVRKRR
ncbi:hypothetical protein ABTX60_29120 [Streptomyces sp. NPDC126510]